MTLTRQILKPFTCALLIAVVCSCSDATVAPVRVPAYMRAVSGTVQSGTTGKTATVTVDVRSVDSLPVVGASVTFSAGGGATVQSAPVITDETGHASVIVALADSAGVYPVTATTSNGVSVMIPLSLRTIVPFSIAIIGGVGQSGPINSTLPVALVAHVFAGSGDIQSGLAVQWQVTSGSATVSPSIALTNASGEASAVVTFGNTPGLVTVSASAGSPTAAIVLTATAR